MQYSCYIEINLICMLLQATIYMRLHMRRSMISTPQKVMMKLAMATGMLCVADIIAIISRGRFFPGARAVIEISNLVYLLMMPVISKSWCEYVLARLGKSLNKLHRLLLWTPFLVFTLIALCNPFTNLLFSINEQNLYARGPGVFLHWIFSWSYFAYAGVVSLRALRAASNWSQRNEIRPLLFFLVLPAIGCIAQMLLYGITSVQAGITLSLVLISMQMQDNQISADELTGINNRRAMRVYVDSVIHGGNGDPLMVMMIDVNRFKRINDTFGHDVGDIALCDTANALKEVCRKSQDQLFLCRYGGDEFVIVGREMGSEETSALVTLIHDAVSAYGQAVERPFSLAVSIGWSSGTCASEEDFGHLLRLADELMYDDKKRQQVAAN